MNKTATKVKDLDGGHFVGSAALYKVTPPLDGSEYVVVSAANVPFSGPETYIFPANSDGDITSWMELDGSFRGELDHEQALVGAGYTVTP